MRVLLISSNVAATPYPTYPLGMSMVSAALGKAGHEVHQADFFELKESVESLLECIRRVDPDIIGISIRNIDNVNLLNEKRYIDVVKGMVGSIKKESAVPIVLGGSGFSIMPQPILRKVGADFGIVGEGERTMVDFVGNAARGIFPEERCVTSPPVLEDKDIPRADYDDRILAHYLKNGNIAAVQTKRGCVNTCVYCSYPLLEGSTIRCRDPREVVDDVENLVDHSGAKVVFFTDSVFNDDGGRYLDVLREMRRRRVSVPWTAFFKPAAVADEEILLFKETGLKAAEIGADAAADKTLHHLGKQIGFKDVRLFNEAFTRHGIATANYFMFGGPGETRETVLEGIDNIIGLKKTVSFIFMGIRILPGTPLAEIARREGTIEENQELLEPVYYISAAVERQWLEKTLTDAFDKVRHCVFPPDRLDTSLQFLHKMGYSGSMLEMLIPGKAMRTRKRRHGAAQPAQD